MRFRQKIFFDDLKKSKKNEIKKTVGKSATKRIVKTVSVFFVFLILVSGIYFNVYNAQSVNYVFNQVNWSGGQTTNVANHTNNQSGWGQYSVKDANINLINSGADIALTNPTGSASIDFNTEGDYVQEDVNNTDFSAGKVTLTGSAGVVASGGTESIFGIYTIRKFTANENLTVTNSGTIDFLVVGGGGSGGGNTNLGAAGGGGAAGGVVYKTSQSISAGSYPVVIGSGGPYGSSGSNSTFFGNTALGGGKGGSYTSGTAGGSGGGGSRGYAGGAAQQPASGSGGFGYAGGTACPGTVGGGGGGGGAGGLGQSTSSNNGGKGGLGVDYSGIFSTNVGVSGWFASGGGGGGTSTAIYKGGTASLGGGSAGSKGSASDATPNTGGGGGGSGGLAGSTFYGGAGGSGVVVVRYQTLFYPIVNPYYVTTGATSQKDTSTWGTITGITTTQTTPANTNIKYLVSFDNKVTWKYWDGSSWQTSTLANIATNGMTKTTLEGISQSNWTASNGFTPGTLDFAASLSTTSTSVTPLLDNIQISYTNPQTQTLTSNTYNTELSQSNLSKIQWTESLPANTDITFQLRTSADGNIWGPWCGPDNATPSTCDSATYFTDPAGNEIIDDTQKDRNNDQYFQYKAFLSSTNGVSTPTLSDISITYTTIITPAVTTDAVTNITSTTATGNGTITDTGGENPIRHIEWGTQTQTYTDSCNASTGGIGTYSCQLTNLIPNTTYYYRAKAVNFGGTVYGSELTFTTPALPVITIINPNTDPDQQKTITALADKGTLTQAVTTENICDNTLTFTAYTAIIFTQESDNGKKVCYKAEDVTSGTVYALSNAITGIDTTHPTIDSVTSDCQNIIDPHFTIAASDNGSGLATQPYSFDGGDTWQAQNTKTYTDFNHTIPAHTIKVKDTAGNSVTYTSAISQSCVQNPVATTQVPSHITPTTATGNGTVTDTGGENSTRYIEWGTQTHTYTDECNASTGGTGAYTCSLTNLTPNTQYFVRAKTTNSSGTTYGDELSFTTLNSTLTIPDPDTDKVTNAVNNGYITTDNNSDLTNVSQATTQSTVTTQTQNANITFPQNTQITGDGSFNFQNFTTQNITNTVRQDHPTSRAAIDLGIPGEQLSFSEDITMQIYVGTVFNDHQMEVLYQNDGESDWHHHTDCTVANGYCTFTTNHATIYTINGVHQATGDLPMNINVEVQETLSMDCFDISDSNTTVQIGTATDPGKVTAGTPAVGQSRCTVTTNADQGYYLTLVNDNTTTHPTLTHTDPNTSTIYEIEDLTQYATNTPNIQNWTAPTTKGLGFSVIHFPQTDISHNTLGNIWTETNACPEGTNPDTNDYAGIPETPQTITAVTAYQETATTTDICYKVDVLPSQPSGQYTGSVTFTATSDASGYYQ